MAIIRFTGLVSEIRGRLNGSVLNKSRNVATMGNSPTPSKSISEEQSVTRAKFQKIQTNWKLLTPEQQADWAILAENVPNRNRFGEVAILSGYNKYMECALNVATKTGFISYPLDTSPLPPVPFDDIILNSLVYFDDGDGERWFNLRYSLINGSITQQAICFEVSKPISAGVTSFQGSYRYMGEEVVTGTPVNQLITGRALPKTWVYREGDRVAVRILYYIYRRGLIAWEKTYFVTVGQQPSIGLFFSTPPNGSAPYTLHISFNLKELIDGIRYRFEARVSGVNNYCVLTPLMNTVSQALTDGLFDNGEYVTTTNVGIGNCRVFDARIVNVATGEIVSYSSLAIDNT